MMLLSLGLSSINNIWSWVSEALTKNRSALIISSLACLIIFYLDAAYSTKSSQTYLDFFSIQFPKNITFYSIKELLHIFFTDLIFDPDALLIGTSTFYIEINHPCSGSIGIAILLIASYAYYSLQKKHLSNKKKIVIFLIGIGLVVSFFGNIARITSLIFLGHIGYAEWAMLGFHEGLGLTFFLGLFMAYVWLIHMLSKTNSMSSNLNEKVPNQPWLFIGPFLLWFLIGVFSLTFTPNLLIASILKVFLAVLFWFFVFQRNTPIIKWKKPQKKVFLYAIIAIVFYWGYSSFFPTQLSKFSLEQINQTTLLLFFGLGFCLFTPLVEEIFFRGCLSRLIQEFNFWELPYDKINKHGMLISSFIFAILHTAILPAFLTGLLACHLLQKTKSLQQAIYFHIIVNTTMFFGSIYWDLGF